MGVFCLEFRGWDSGLQERREGDEVLGFRAFSEHSRDA